MHTPFPGKTIRIRKGRQELHLVMGSEQPRDMTWEDFPETTEASQRMLRDLERLMQEPPKPEPRERTA